MRRTVNDLIEAEKLVDGGFASVAVADDLGKPIPLVFGRAVKVPLLYVKADGSNRHYDYILGEGVGLNGNNFQEVFTVYREDKALDVIQGDVASATSTTLDLESADQRPNQWYQYWWVEITAGTGVGQIRDITSYDADNNRITVSSAFSPTPDATSDYKLTEYRFYDGSQASPYDDYAFIRFKKRLGTSSRTDDLYADVNGFSDEVNRARAIESILTNNVWGLGLTVDATSFTSAASAMTALSLFTCEGAIIEETTAIDVLLKLLSFRDMVLTKGENIEISIDAAKSSTFNFGLGDDTGFNNILTRNPEIRFIHPEQKVKTLKVRYRRNHRESDTYLHEFTRSANSNGIDDTLELPFVYDHATADIALDYKRKRLIAADRELSLDVGKDGRNANRGDRITVDIPTLGGQSSWEVNSSTSTITGASLNLVPYSDSPYTYVSFTSEGGTLPVDESFDIPPDFTKTNPDPVSSVNVAGGFDTQENGTKVGFLDVTWTPPNDGNYSGARVFIKENGQPSTSYQAVGVGFDNFRVPSLEVGLAFDVLVVSLNIDGSLQGLGTEDLNTLIPGDTTAPNAPTGLTFDGAFLGKLVWTFTASNSTDVVEYEYQIDNFSSFATPIFDGSTGLDLKVEWKAQDSGSLRSNITRWCRVRAIDRSGNPSSWTTGVSGTTDEIVEDDIGQEEVLLLGSFFNSASSSGGITHTVTVTTRGETVDIDASWIFSGNAGLIITLQRDSTILSTHIYSFPNTATPGHMAITYRDNGASVGSHTYTVTMGNVPANSISDRSMKVTEVRN